MSPAATGSATMHELAVTESILQLAADTAREKQAERVTDIYLTIGKWSSLVDDSIQFYWDHISQGTICEGAQLHFNRPPAVMRCADCGRQYEVDEDLKPCPSCGSVHLSLISGDEMQVDQIEINS